MVLWGCSILFKEVLKLKDVNKSYPSSAHEEILVLNQISLKLSSKGIYLILGPHGSGKSTLLRISGFLESPSSGSVAFAGRDLTEPESQERLNLIRNEIGFVPPYPSLLPYLTILENVMLPMVRKNKFKVLEILKSIGVENNGSYPHQISVEEQQRASIARAMVNDPHILLVDEPTSPLSETGANEIMHILRDLKKEYTIMIFTDDPLLSKYSDTVFKLHHGVLEKI
ncbi:MAG TPA: ATP-binding cassette domain-containing protein [Methanobacteriaceae archaeon]|nr:ATP-binding cassette domain-containing protein [Methanobacteriaceae archaeon]